MSYVEPMTDSYQVTVVGGGPAGLTAALYATRLGHDTAVINRGGGRAAMMLDTHNVIGVTENVSGNEFLATATEQVQAYGADYMQDYVTDIEPLEGEATGFRVTAGNTEVTTDHVVLATGFSDEKPDPPLPRTGMGLHWCLHCDAYMFVDEPVYVMGTNDAAAHVAMIMLNFTPEVDVLTRGDGIEWSDEAAEMLENHPVDVIHDDIVGMEKDDDGWLSAFEFEDGTVREYRGGVPHVRLGLQHRSRRIARRRVERRRDDRGRRPRSHERRRDLRRRRRDARTQPDPDGDGRGGPLWDRQPLRPPGVPAEFGGHRGARPGHRVRRAGHLRTAPGTRRQPRGTPRRPADRTVRHRRRLSGAEETTTLRKRSSEREP